MACDSVSERLRRWARNPLGSARRGSNPLAVAMPQSFPLHQVSLSLSLSLSVSDSLVDSLSDSLSDSLVDSLSDSLVDSLSLILSLILRNGLTVVGEIRRTSHKTSEMALPLSGRSIGAPSEIRIALTTIEGAEWTQNGRGAVAAQP